MDRKLSVQGVYPEANEETTWTLPYLDADGAFQIVTGPSWDTATVKAAGTQVLDAVNVTDSGVTTLVVDGDWENDADGNDAPVFIGIQYEASATFSEQFARGENQQPSHGNLHLLRGKVRHRDSGGYSIEIIPEGRDTLIKDYVVPTIGSTPFDTDQLDDFGEFQFRVMSHARNLSMRLINDTPFPTTWVDAEFHGEFIPNSYSPVR